jgi:dTDP-4-amino-4,6-dideoxygalactose transaminase
MNDVNATIGITNFHQVVENLKIHRKNANYYLKELQNIECVELLNINEKINSAYWLFTFKIKNRDEFISFMARKGVCVSQVHGRNDTHTCVKEFNCELPILDEFSKKIVCIPVGWWISQDDAKYIVDCIKEWDLN